MARARSDLSIAKAPLPPDAFLEDLCFHAQQAAEKALKAVYQHYGWTFRYTHDLETLISGLRDEGLDVPSVIMDADMLSRYAWEARYPGVQESVGEPEYREATRMAEALLKWASSLIEN